MRSSLPQARRRFARVLTAAALVSLTAACGPADLGLGAAAPTVPAAADPTPSTSTGTGEELPADAAAVPGEAPVPAPVAPLEEPAELSTAGSAEPLPGGTPELETEDPDDSEDEDTVESPDRPANAATPPAAGKSPTGKSPAGKSPAGKSPAGKSAAGKPAATQPAATQPAAGNPAATQPAATQPAATQPAATQPAATQPAAGTAAAGVPAAGQPAAGAVSAGSGGAFTDQARASFTAGNGQTGRYLRYAGGIDPSRPVGLVVYVDGTGEYGVDNPSASYALGGSSGLVAVSRARNMITLAVESPNQSCECWHTGDTAAYADFLAGLIESQRRAYPIGEVWLAGFSSGAQEITRFLVPRHPELMSGGGGWVVFGGGGPPASSGAAVTAARMAGVRGHWFTGTADTAVPLTASWGARAGESWYAARGVTVSSEYPSGVGHELGGRLGPTVARLIDAG